MYSVITVYYKQYDKYNKHDIERIHRPGDMFPKAFNMLDLFKIKDIPEVERQQEQQEIKKGSDTLWQISRLKLIAYCYCNGNLITGQCLITGRLLVFIRYSRYSKRASYHEKLAKVKAVINVAIGSKSQFLGDVLPITGDSRATWDK